MRSHPYKLYGLATVLVIVTGVTLAVAQFNQAFRPVDRVTVHIERAGLQLLPGSDVKVRGLIVGEVGSITSTGQGADLHLRLDPREARRLPDNVSVRLVPKTVFGEKYVDLVLPSHPSSSHLHDGLAIGEDRSTAALEIDQALDDLLPMLRTVQPTQLDQTLTALATALSGRGEQLGRTIVQLDDYLRAFNPQLPVLQHDLAAMSGVTTTYDEAAGSLLRMMRNLTVTSDTIVSQQARLRAFLDDMAGAASATADLLARNERNLVSVNAVSREVVALLARYSPEFPCFFRGYAKLAPRVHHAVGTTPGITHSAHVVIEFVPSFPAYQNPIDLPEFNDTRGPSCYGLPDPPMSLPVIRYKDGTEDDPRFDNQDSNGIPAPTPTGASAAAYSPAMGSAGTAEERRAFNAVLAPMLGLQSLSVPDVADLLWGPMARGAGVRLS